MAASETVHLLMHFLILQPQVKHPPGYEAAPAEQSHGKGWVSSGDAVLIKYIIIYKIYKNI